MIAGRTIPDVMIFDQKRVSGLSQAKRIIIPA
jgi:hypothetical protein